MSPRSTRDGYVVMSYMFDSLGSRESATVLIISNQAELGLEELHAISLQKNDKLTWKHQTYNNDLMSVHIPEMG